MKMIAPYIVFLMLVFGGSAVIGMVAVPTDVPSEWYATLIKPSFTPPSWVFAPAWTFLYILIAVAGCRTWLRDPKGSAMKLWTAQLLLNFLWSPVFFGAHRIDIALAVIILLLITIVAYILYTVRQDKIAAVLFLPYLAWVSFATILNAALLDLNRY